MTDDEYKEIIVAYVKCCIEVKPNSLINNLTDFDYLLSQEITDWNNKEWAKLSTNGVNITKTAIVLSRNFISNLAVEQTKESYSEEHVTGDNITRTFDKRSQAVKWVKGTLIE